jgi:acyl carrier protein
MFRAGPDQGVDAAADDVAHRVIDLAASVLELDRNGLTLGDSPQTIERWDSLNHLKLITAVETAFAIRLPMQTVIKIRDLGGLVAAVRNLAGA